MAAFVMVDNGAPPERGQVAVFEVRGEHIAVANVAGTLEIEI